MKPIRNSVCTKFNVGDVIASKWAVGGAWEDRHRFIIEGFQWCYVDWRNNNMPLMTQMCQHCTSGNVAYSARTLRHRRGRTIFKLCAGREAEGNQYVQVPDPRPASSRTRRRG